MLLKLRAPFCCSGEVVLGKQYVFATEWSTIVRGLGTKLAFRNYLSQDQGNYADMLRMPLEIMTEVNLQLLTNLSVTLKQRCLSLLIEVSIEAGMLTILGSKMNSIQ